MLRRSVILVLAVAGVLNARGADSVAIADRRPTSLPDGRIQLDYVVWKVDQVSGGARVWVQSPNLSTVNLLVVLTNSSLPAPAIGDALSMVGWPASKEGPGEWFAGYAGGKPVIITKAAPIANRTNGKVYHMAQDQKAPVVTAYARQNAGGAMGSSAPVPVHVISVGLLRTVTPSGVIRVGYVGTGIRWP